MARWLDGPVAKKREERLALAREVSDRARLKFDAVAVGVYGSIARGEDGPYSDIEILCVTAATADEDWEWLHDGWNVEVNVRDRATLFGEATTVSGDWPISHANYLRLWPILDPERFFVELAAAIGAVPNEDFNRAIGDVLGHLYGATSKMRNARSSGASPPPGFLHYIVKLGYCMIGLANRQTYSTATAAAKESLDMVDRPAGYDALCRMTMDNDLANNEKAFDACDTFWRGAAEWAAARGIRLDSSKHLI